MVSVSIIIPVYNAELYLPRCIESILKQTFNDFEVILINDGSTDNSYFICKEYMNKDKRIKLINQENRGVSYARNQGIAGALGDYIMFVDSDDTIEEDMVDYLYSLIRRSDYEVAVCDYTLYKNGYCNKKKVNKVVLEYSGNDNIMDEYVLSNKFRYSPVNKLYKKSLLIKNDIRFLTEIKYSEDAIFNYEVFSMVNKLIYSNEPKYNYYLNENSTVAKVTGKRLDVLEGIVKIYDLVKKKYPRHISKISNNYVESSVAIIIDIINEKKVFEKKYIIKEVSNRFKKNQYIYHEKKALTTKNRLCVVLFLISPWIIVILYKIRFLILKFWRK